MFECFKPRIERMRLARRKAIAAKRYEQVAGLLGPRDENAQFDSMKSIIEMATKLENESCGCPVCAALRNHMRASK